MARRNLGKVVGDLGNIGLKTEVILCLSSPRIKAVSFEEITLL